MIGSACVEPIPFPIPIEIRQNMLSEAKSRFIGRRGDFLCSFSIKITSVRHKNLENDFEAIQKGREVANNIINFVMPDHDLPKGQAGISNQNMSFLT